MITYDVREAMKRLHEPKEPRPGRDFEREHFEQALGCYRQSILDTLADEADSSMTREDVANARRREAKELDEVMSRWDTEHDAAKELAAERDEWKRRAEAAEEERDILMLEPNKRLDGYRRLGEKCARLEAERDAAVRSAVHFQTLADGHIDRGLLTDMRIEAWRALDGEQRAYTIERMRAEAGRRTGYNDDKGAAAWTAAAAALEALAEPRP